MQNAIRRVVCMVSYHSRLSRQQSEYFSDFINSIGGNWFIRTRNPLSFVSCYRIFESHMLSCLIVIAKRWRWIHDIEMCFLEKFIINHQSTMSSWSMWFSQRLVNTLLEDLNALLVVHIILCCELLTFDFKHLPLHSSNECSYHAPHTWYLICWIS